ncbi:MAG: hypothetical protein PF501_07295 [Salinisphaera sp.]|jgi:hypothetical protein|nr:hypothetical protein [Salinisphaera sp.]
MRPVVLDVDGSVGELAGAHRSRIAVWGQRLRFACSRRALRAFSRGLPEMLPVDTGVVFTGSGDFHHLSLPLIERVSAMHGPLDVVIFDNHPDNMRFPFGVHCGSWVSAVAALAQVRHVHVVGITSGDIGAGHAWENRLWPLFAGRLTYWSTGVSVGWASTLGLGRAFKDFDSVDALLASFGAYISSRTSPVYLSIDKDVLGVEDARTNWDQGRMRASGLLDVIETLHGRIVGGDITGEISLARYAQWWKRRLSALDHQPEVTSEQLTAWQPQQHALNQRLLEAIEDAWAMD